MASGYTDTAIANLALGHLNEKTIADFDQTGNSNARWFKTNYAHYRNELLSLYPWNCARSRVLLPEAADKPAFGWDYAFRLPADFLSGVPIYDDDGTEISVEYEGDEVLTNHAGPLKFRYIKRLNDPAKFNQYFINCLVPYLALGMAHKVTGKNSYAQTMQTLFDDAFEKNTALEDQQNSPMEALY